MKKNKHEEMMAVIEAGVMKTLRAEYNPPPSDDFMKNFINGRRVLAPLNGLKVAKWLFDTASMLENLPSAPVERFFVLVNGIVDSKELTKFFESYKCNAEKILKNPEVYEKHYEGGVARLSLDEALPKFSNAIETIEKIRVVFSEDDIVLIKFLRHHFCHPTLDSYMPKITGSTKKWDFDDSKYKPLANALELKNSDAKNFKLEIGQRLIPFISDLKSLGKLCEDLTYRFEKYDHEIFEKWFRE